MAFGSQAYGFFEDLDDESYTGCRVLIYASHADGADKPAATWQGTYVEYLRSEEHFQRIPKLRPKSCLEEDKSGYWAGYYVVADLEELDRPIPISKLRKVNGKPFDTSFVPEGPVRALMS